MRAIAAVLRACMRTGGFWAVVLSIATVGIAWPVTASIHAPKVTIAKKQDRAVPVNAELSPVHVAYAVNPWVNGHIPSIKPNDLPLGSVENPRPVETISYRGDHYAPKPTQEADRSERKRLEELKKKQKRSDATDEVIRRAAQSALLANAKAHIGKRGSQIGLPSSLWCMDFINHVLKRVGLPTTGSRMARSPLTHPKFVKIVKPQPGDIVVIARGRGTTYGHVALYNGSCGKGGIKLLGGNQGGGRVTNQCVSGARVVGYVRPKTIPETVVARLLT